MQPKAVHEAAAAASLVWNGDGINLDMRLKICNTWKQKRKRSDTAIIPLEEKKARRLLA